MQGNADSAAPGHFMNIPCFYMLVSLMQEVFLAFFFSPFNAKVIVGLFFPSVFINPLFVHYYYYYYFGEISL